MEMLLLEASFDGDGAFVVIRGTCAWGYFFICGSSVWLGDAGIDLFYG